MQRIDSIDGFFHEGNPATGQKGTKVKGDWLNAIQEELAKVVEASGQILDEAENNQMEVALRSGRLQDVIYARVYDTLAEADAAAVAAGRRLIISTPWDIPVGATLNAYVEMIHGGVLNVAGALNVPNGLKGCPGCLNLTGTGNVQLPQGVIYPYFFVGTDAKKVQDAFNTALNFTPYTIDYANNREFNVIVFDRMYDITGSTILIKKADASTNAVLQSIDRRHLYLIGKGGGIRKMDGGFVFSVPDTILITGDITSSGMKYQSSTGSGVTVWNNDKLIRVRSLGDTYRDIDHVGAARGPRGPGYPGLCQSVTFKACNVTGGTGWAWEFVDAADVSIDYNLVEMRTSVGGDSGAIRNYEVVNDPPTSLNSALRIRGNVIEGISGTALRLGASTGLTVTGNYLEANFCNFDFSSVCYTNSLGVVVIGNFLNPLSVNAPDQTIAHIKWGHLGGDGATSIGNVGIGQPLHSIGPQGVATGVLFSTGDYGTIHADTVGSALLVKAKDIATLKTQMAAVDAETTGNWTPVIKGATTPGANGYALQAGVWRKRGKRVFFTCIVALNAKDAAMAGAISIGGLTHEALAGYYFPCTIGKLRYTALGAGKFAKAANVFGFEIKLTELATNNTDSDEVPANLTANTYYSISGTYYTA